MTWNKQTLPYFIIFIGLMAVSSASVFIRFAQKDVPSLVIAAYRLTLATLILFPFCLKGFIKEIFHTTWKQKTALMMSGFFLALHFGTWITSLEYTRVASSVVLVATTPLWVAILSPFLLKERLDRWTAVGLVVALIGTVIVAISGNCQINLTGLKCNQEGFQTRDLIGDGLALAGALFASGYMIIGRKVQQGLSFSSYIFSVYGSAAIVLIILVLASREALVGYREISYIWMAALAIIPQLIGHSSFNWALKSLPAAYVAITLLGEPVGTVILSMVFLKEIPTVMEVAGGVFILLGILLASRLKRK
jgi:drug/metabolite transporter (DMT)-like permease